jgi:UDP-N-acetyl-D-glucosamine dehydrogenase
MSVGVIGLGYVGLPLAVAFAEAGADCVGLDVNARVVAELGAGRSTVEDISDERLAAALGEHLRVTSDYSELVDTDAILICVPTPLANQREPDLAYIDSAARALAPILRAGQLVVLESTTYPGTTTERLKPMLEESGLAAGRDFHLAFSPERIDPGRTDHTMRTTPKVVGGLTEACRDRTIELYSQICDEVVPVSSPEAAELTKLLENIFRSVNIALVNELAMLCDRMGIDVWEVVDAASTKPFGFMRFDPGPGMGGHCLPVDPFYLAFKAREYDFPTEFIELAGKINLVQPHFCVEKVVRALNDVGKPAKGARVLLLGMAYKAGVSDLRESPGVKIARLLRDLGADVSFHDPHAREVAELELASVPLAEGLASCDVACVVTAHEEIDYGEVVATAPLVVDFRGVTRGIEAANLVRL